MTAGDRALNECSRGVLVNMAKVGVQSFEKIVALLERSGDQDRSEVADQWAVKLHDGIFFMASAMGMLEPQRYGKILYDV